jgi:hypothetical protein
MEKPKKLLWLIGGLSVKPDPLLKSLLVILHYLLDKEFLIHYSPQFLEVLVPSQVLLVVEKHVFLKLYPNIQTQKLLSTSDVEKEEMKWLKS